MFADDAPDLQKITIDFFNLISVTGHALYVSDVVTKEFDRAKVEKRAKLYGLLSQHSPTFIPRTTEVGHLMRSTLQPEL